ncbi:hypothetical protein FQR65_LT05471 [Abscondita terminalis]|nr:hypothetical protein FQR65_LT05471 [Abscondita terminalis]
MYNLVAVLVLGCVSFAELKPQGSVSNGVGHYWRDYQGYAPSDALPVGPNIYIGQVFANGIRKPAYIDQQKKYAVFVQNGQVYSTRDQIKIFCSTDPSQFEWVKTDTSNIGNVLPNRFPIYGGQLQNNQPLFIGRSHDNQIVGMVVVNSESDGLHYPLNGHAALAEEFDVFVYKN